MTQLLRDPRGGLTQEGRDFFNKRDGSNLKPGVKRAKTQEEMRRKGSFLRRFYARSEIPPLTDSRGRPTRFALAAQAWGEPIPKTIADVRKLAAKGQQLLDKAKQMRSGGMGRKRRSM